MGPTPNDIGSQPPAPSPQNENEFLKEKPPLIEIAEVKKPFLVAGPLREGEAEDSIEPSAVETIRPSWGLGNGPLFSNLEENLPVIPGSEMEDPVLFEDSVSRLSALGYNPRRCRMALEAAM